MQSAWVLLTFQFLLSSTGPPVLWFSHELPLSALQKKKIQVILDPRAGCTGCSSLLFLIAKKRRAVWYVRIELTVQTRDLSRGKKVPVMMLELQV